MAVVGVLFESSAVVARVSATPEVVRVERRSKPTRRPPEIELTILMTDIRSALADARGFVVVEPRRSADPLGWISGFSEHALTLAAKRAGFGWLIRLAGTDWTPPAVGLDDPIAFVSEAAQWVHEHLPEVVAPERADRTSAGPAPQPTERREDAHSTTTAHGRQLVSLIRREVHRLRDRLQPEARCALELAIRNVELTLVNGSSPAEVQRAGAWLERLATQLFDDDDPPSAMAMPRPRPPPDPEPLHVRALLPTGTLDRS